MTLSNPGTFSCNWESRLSRWSALRFTPEYSSNSGSLGRPLSSMVLGRCVNPITLGKVVGVGYERRFLVTAHPEMSLAPKTRATLSELLMISYDGESYRHTRSRALKNWQFHVAGRRHGERSSYHNTPMGELERNTTTVLRSFSSVYRVMHLNCLRYMQESNVATSAHSSWMIGFQNFFSSGL